MGQNIIFFGSGWFVVPVIEKLRKFNLQLVITNEVGGKVVNFCKKNNIPYVCSNLKDNETIEKIKKLNPTVAVLASFGAFIPNGIIGLFENGIINIHPSLLPKWKGPSPVQYSLLNGETQTGVTLIKLDNEIDHGPVLSQRPYNLQGNETAEDMLSILFEIGADMVVDVLAKLESGEKIIGIPQDHSKETWSYKITKQDGYIDINKLNANRYPEGASSTYTLNAMIKAFYPWPGVWLTTQLKNQTKIVKLLPEEKIQVEGKNAMNYKDFINGFGDEGKTLLEKLNLS